jgi:hypothetical protein
MRRSVTLVALLSVFASACTPSLRLQVLEPSLVTSPPEIERLTVIDRSRARNVGQGVLGVLEGALTGEAIGADTNGRSRAMGAMVVSLRDSPRFEAAESFAPRKDLESTLWAKELSWETAQTICEQSGCQGIVALEAFDSDSHVDISKRLVKEQRDGKEVSRTVFSAERTTTVTTAWRYYDVANRQILDDMRSWDTTRTWREEGPSQSAARGALPNQSWTVAAVGEMAGAEYARRIAPTYVFVSRTYYGKGDDQLKAARNSVRAQDWAGAIRIWSALHRSSPDPKVKGKAAFNLALAAERDGDLRGAAEWATEAAKILSNGRSRRYRATLERRLADEAQLQRQMAPPPGQQPLAIPG